MKGEIYITPDMTTTSVEELPDLLNALMEHIGAPIKFSVEKKWIRNAYDMSRVGTPVGKVIAYDFSLIAEKVE